MKSFFLALGILLLCSNTWASNDLLVAVASNFQPALEKLAHDFESQTGVKIRIASGSTGGLFTQIQNGAPFDLYFAADQKRPEELVNQGLAVASSRRTYALGQLVILGLSPDQWEGAWEQIQQKRIVIANPLTAPYGVAARQVLQNIGIWEHLDLVYAGSVSKVIQIQQTGNAQFAFAAASTVVPLGLKPSARVPAHLYQPIVQQVVLLESSHNKELATRFLSYLQTDSVREKLVQFGYLLPSRVN